MLKSPSGKKLVTNKLESSVISKARNSQNKSPFQNDITVKRGNSLIKYIDKSNHLEKYEYGN